jgi:hypothetical protein
MPYLLSWEGYEAYLHNNIVQYLGLSQNNLGLICELMCVY